MSIKDLDLKGNTVVLRAEFNVPMKEGKIINDTRIQAELPTLQYLLNEGAKLIILTHLGRPKGKANPEFTVEPVAVRLGELLKEEVTFIPYGSLEEVKERTLQVKKVGLLENIRFWPEEEKNDPDFSRFLASLGDIYINDAFGCAHRAHASTEGIGHYLDAHPGFLMEKEIAALSGAVNNPKKPLVVVMGGSKVSDKIKLIENLSDKADYMCFGGAMANTLLAAKGINMGNSKVETEELAMAKDLMEKVETKCKVCYPLDFVAADEFSEAANTKITSADGVEEGWMALDIGPETVKAWKEIFEKAGTIIWNGPLGVYEMKAFEKGSFGVAEAMANSGAISVVGGGDAVSAVKASGFGPKMSHLSTGGGASLELLEGKVLPGIAILK